MILGAFGDSFLHGSDLSDCHLDIFSKKTWPAIIAKNNHFDYYCFAYPGIGNQVILDDLLRAVAKYGNNMFYIINWTWIDRYDYIGINQSNSVWSTVRPGQNDRKSNFYYKNFHSELLDKIQSLTRIYTAIQALTATDCKFIMTYMDYLVLDQRWHAPESVCWLQEQCRNHLSDFSGQNFLNWSRNNGFPESKLWHPLEEAHQKAADFWMPKVRTLLNTHAKED
jgi:hypothetical protein